MEKIWKPIPKYEEHYLASNYGEVASIKKGFKLLKQCKSSNVYLFVNLWKNGKCKSERIHYIIANSFLNHISSGQKLIIDHIDNNRLNNRLDNLQIISQRENSNKDKPLPKSGVRGVYWNNINKKWQVRLRVNGKKINILYHDNKEYCGLIYKEISNLIDINKTEKSTEELKELIKEYKLKIKNYDNNQ